MAPKDDFIGRMTPKRMLSILLQEIADVRLELKEDIAALGGALGSRMGRLEGRMNGIEHRMDGIEHRMDGIEHRMDRFEGRMKGLAGQMNQNHLSFMTYLSDVDGRVKILEQV